MQLPQTRIKGKLFWKKRWYSICSTHADYQEDCPRCNVGGWHNMWLLSISNFFHTHFWNLWFYWNNGRFPKGTYEDYTDISKKK